MLRRCLLLASLGACVLAPRGAGAEPAPDGPKPVPRANRAPKFLPALEVTPFRSTEFGTQLTRVRVGRRTRVTLSAEDPDGDELRFAVDPLPPGATFDARSGSLAWQPQTPGRLELEFSVTDGSATARRRFSFVIGPNRAPVSAGSETLLALARNGRVPVDGGIISTQSGMPVIAYDPDADEITVHPKALPAGATLGTSEAGTGVSLTWRPTEAQVGEHELVFVVSDGELSTELRRRVMVLPAWSARDSVRWALLGGGPATFLSHTSGELFVGGAFDVSLARTRSSGLRAARCVSGGYSDECAASHHRFYAEFEVLDSLRASAPSLFTYGVGYSASFEWNPARRYVIPHYGVEVGGLVRAELGHRAAVRPYLGLHLVTRDVVWLNAVLGYRVVPAELVELSGPTLGLKLVLAPW
jgi:hypothetical protein